MATTIKLNGQSDIENVTCFSFVPTILELKSTAGGSPTTYQCYFTDFSGLDYTKTYTFRVNGTALTSVRDIKDAKGYHFYWDNTSTGSTRKMMIDTLVNAIRRIPEVMAGYSVYMPHDGNGGKSEGLIITAEKNGGSTPLTIETDIPNITNATLVSGNATTDFKKGNIKIDVYKANSPTKQGTAPLTATYKTTLSKHTNNDASVKFDLGGILSSLTEDGEVSQFAMDIYNVDDVNGMTPITRINSLYNVNGYLINQGREYISPLTQPLVAMNAYRGANRNFLNNTILYIYDDSIPLSLYTSQSTSKVIASVRYIDSAGASLYIDTLDFNTPKPLTHIRVQLNQTYKVQAKYIDVDLGSSIGTLRFNVIKPMKQNAENQRIEWYNSYGGISFFDFTADRTEERKVKNVSYQDSILNYYDNDINERDYIYDKQNEITVKLTSHNIHKDAQWHLFDLQQSRNAWTWVNGQKYRILVDDLTINTTSVEDIYTATIEYKYSLGVSL